MYEDIKARYEKGYIRDDQLARYVALDVITQAQADELKDGKKWTGGGYNNLTICAPPKLTAAQLASAVQWLAGRCAG